MRIVNAETCLGSGEVVWPADPCGCLLEQLQQERRRFASDGLTQRRARVLSAFRCPSLLSAFLSLTDPCNPSFPGYALPRLP
jgi:hypothetical protein